jgi:glyoxylase-like metal-dependent hydrolase (beta-lactamase superfamily II)
MNMKYMLSDLGQRGGICDDSGLWKSYVRPDSALLRMGIKATEITDIIITHPHYDHIGGIVLFPSAQVWMQKDDYDYFVGAAWQKKGFNEGVSGHSLDRNIPGNHYSIQMPTLSN